MINQINNYDEGDEQDPGQRPQTFPVGDIVGEGRGVVIVKSHKRPAGAVGQQVFIAKAPQ